MRQAASGRRARRQRRHVARASIPIGARSSGDDASTGASRMSARARHVGTTVVNTSSDPAAASALTRSSRASRSVRWPFHHRRWVAVFEGSGPRVGLGRGACTSPMAPRGRRTRDRLDDRPADFGIQGASSWLGGGARWGRDPKPRRHCWRAAQVDYYVVLGLDQPSASAAIRKS